MKYPKFRNSRPVQGTVDVSEQRDVYLKEEPPSEPARCPVCGNIYKRKHWNLPDQVNLDSDEKTVSFTCPGCSKVQDGYYYGELTITGRFIAEHHDEISHLVQNEVHRAQQDNPLSKLVQVQVDGDKLNLRTTNSKLAERIGRKLEQSYGGELDIDKSEYITRVNWHRDDLPDSS